MKLYTVKLTQRIFFGLTKQSEYNYKINASEIICGYN